MKRYIVVFVIICILLMLCSCKNDDKKGESKAVKDENMSEFATEIKKEYEYSKYFDKNIIWGKNQLTNAVTPEIKLGTVVCSYELQELLDENAVANETEKRYAISLMEVSGKDVEYVYSELIQQLDFETEFDGMTDEEVQTKLEEMKTEGTDEFQMFRCTIYATKEELLSMVCQIDMKILLDTVIRPQWFKVTEESVWHYEDTLLPVYYYKDNEKVREYVDKETAISMIEGVYASNLFWDWEFMYVNN